MRYDGKREWRDYLLPAPQEENETIVTIITFTSEYAMKEFEYYYEKRTMLFSSLDVERDGKTLRVYKFFSDEIIEEMKADFSIIEVTT